ncbi:hypothetical protein GCM10022224_030860 [Nonomuraea antimicrobica]|uniref:Uncharacterized protein n=2 Tax=Nonomuraea antimicrobica TaxID=561173 RepID=A0ABP7BLX2_9ACTN
MISQVQRSADCGSALGPADRHAQGGRLPESRQLGGEDSSLKPEVLAERLMLEIYGYGTNTGTRAAASSGHAHSEDDIRYVRWG